MFKQITTLTLILMALQGTGAPVTAADHRCFSAEITETVVLPDGSKHAPGRLRICTDRTFSPVSTLHRVYVGGMAVGMYLSTSRGIERIVEPGTAQFVFERRAAREFTILGYTVETRGKTTYHEMSPGTTRKAEFIACAENEPPMPTEPSL